MTIYENFMLKQHGEYIYARICCKIATVLNEKHKSGKRKPDFVISKGIEFITKSKVCLERYDKELWKEIVHIASEEFKLLTDEEIQACRAYIQEMEDEHLTDKEIILDICSEFETNLEHWVFEYVEDEMLYGRMSKKEGNKILFSNARGDSPFPFIGDDDWDEDDDDIDDIWDEFERLRNDLDAMDHESSSPLNAKVVKTKFHS